MSSWRENEGPVFPYNWPNVSKRPSLLARIIGWWRA